MKTENQNPITGQQVVTSLSVVPDAEGCIEQPSVFTTMSIEYKWEPDAQAVDEGDADSVERLASPR